MLSSFSQGKIEDITQTIDEANDTTAEVNPEIDGTEFNPEEYAANGPSTGKAIDVKSRVEYPNVKYIEDDTRRRFNTDLKRVAVNSVNCVFEQMPLEFCMFAPASCRTRGRAARGLFPSPLAQCSFSLRPDPFDFELIVQITSRRMTLSPRMSRPTSLKKNISQTMSRKPVQMTTLWMTRMMMYPWPTTLQMSIDHHQWDVAMQGVDQPFIYPTGSLLAVPEVVRAVRQKTRPLVPPLCRLLVLLASDMELVVACVLDPSGFVCFF